MIGVFFSEFIVRLISKCFHSMKCSVDVPSGTTPFISFTPKRFILRSSQVGPLSTFLINSNIGFSIRHLPRCAIDSLSHPQHLQRSEAADGL